VSTSSGKADRQNGETREAMFARIHRALGARAVEGEPSAPTVDEALVRLCERTDDLIVRFQRQATAVGMRVQRVPEADVVPAIAALLRAPLGDSVVLDIDDAAVADWAEAALASAGATRIDWQGGDSLAAHFRADVAITDVDAAIAESGSLVLSSSRQRSRAAHLLVPVQVAIVRACRVWADQVEFWQHSHSTGNSAATVLVTGPSKTADIEGILVTGVHGPGTVHVLLVD
jgi:L-lactate dehydrogenase complex protein LldG